MSFTTDSGLRRSTRLSKHNVNTFEDFIDNIVERKFNFKPIDGEGGVGEGGAVGDRDGARRYPLRENTRISYTSFFNKHVDDGHDDGHDDGGNSKPESDTVSDTVSETGERTHHRYNLRKRKRVRFVNQDNWDGDLDEDLDGDVDQGGYPRSSAAHTSYCPLRSSNFISKLFNY